jgi:dTDP-3-amino-3,4,6-trideoxy-alpha-D-glucose transaminase
MILANDFQRQWTDVGDDVLSAVEQVGRSGWYVLGDEVKRFEQELAMFWGTKHAAGVANGMDAVEIGLRLLGCGPGDRVLTTPISAFATTLAIVKLRAVPVFIDTDEHGLIDLVRCYDLLKERRDIHYMVPVHLYGHALDRGGLEWLRDEFGIKMLEDCAQSAGARWQGKPTGTVGQIAATSFYPTKNLGAMGDGGAILTNDPAIDARARVLRVYGETTRYRHEQLGYNSRLDEMQAAILRRACLPRLVKWVARRRAIADAYNTGIRNREVGLPGVPEGTASSWHLFPIHVAPTQRASLVEHLKANGIAPGVHYPTALPDQPAMSKVAFEMADACALARQICASEISLPIHPYMTDEEVAQVIDVVNAFARQTVVAQTAA